MRFGFRKLGHLIFWTAGLVGVLALSLYAQAGPGERGFHQSKSIVEQTLKAMQANMSGHLPVLDGFAQPGDHPLDRYQRGYYQAEADVIATPSGGSLVRISIKVTAWYSDPEGSHSGYVLLKSNGRLEADLLDQLADQLAKASGGADATAAASASAPVPIPPSKPVETAPSAPAPASKFPQNDRTFSSSLSQGLATQPADKSAPSGQGAFDKPSGSLRAEAESLEEILKNQAHPKNLVAVKKSGTPVVSTPSLTAKPQFLASMHDEFEMLNFNADWVHVRISGLSRGWIWRNSVEMPEGIADTDAPAASALTPVADLFHVIREETAPFPGDWEPLRSKTVKIISVQKLDENGKPTGPKDRLEYAKFVLEKTYNEPGPKPADLAGIVVIFDSADGGMIAATMPTLKDWRAGALSDSALWHKCFFDPPETFDSTAPAGSQ